MKNKKNVTVISILAASMIMSGCMRTTANPVQTSQIGDDKMTCLNLENEMQDMKIKMRTAESDRNNQVAANAALGFTGWFLILPLFFIDTSNAHTIEEQAASDRHKKLQAIYQAKGCGVSEAQKTADATEQHPQ